MQHSKKSPAFRFGTLAIFLQRQAGFAAKKLLLLIIGLCALILAAALLYPQPSKLSMDELESIYATPSSRFMDLGGVRTHYMDEGSGPVIVIAHASFMNLRSWDAVAEILTKKYRVIRLDFLTAGLTGPEPNDRYSFDRNVELLNELTQKLGVKKFALVGTSSGGIVAFNYASRFPEQISRLILINSAGLPRNASTDPNRLRGNWLTRWWAKRYQSHDTVRDTLDINFIEPHEPPEWLVNMTFDMNRREGLEREGALLFANFKTGNPQQVLSKVQAPTLVAWGLENQTVFHLQADVFSSWLSNAPHAVKKYSGLGHYPYIEEPALIASEIDSFLSGSMDDRLVRHRRSMPKQADTAIELRYSTVTGANGVPLQVVEAGPRSAPGILFIHGWSLSSSSWQQQLRSELADQFHLVALDLRGHGNSAKPWDAANYAESRIWADDIAAVIKATGLKQPVVVAWSMGGHVIMDYIRHYSADSLAGIVFVGSTGGMQPFPPPDEKTAAEFVRLGPLSMSGDAGERLEAAREFVDGMMQAPVPQEIRDREVAATLALPPYARTAMMTRKLDNSDLVEKLTVPTLFLLGDAERTTTPQNIAKLIARMPDARLKVYEATGHMPFIERQQRFEADLTKFVLELGKDNLN